MEKSERNGKKFLRKCSIIKKMSIRYKEKMTEMKMDRQHFCMGCMHPLREQGNCPFCDFLPEKYKALLSKNCHIPL